MGCPEPATLDGRQRIGPACPDAANLPRVALRSQSPPTLSGRLPLQLVGYLVEERAETLPNACIVLPGKAPRQPWMNDSEAVVGSRRSTKQRQEPRALHGIRLRSVRWDSTVAWSCETTNSGWPNGVPRMQIPRGDIREDLLLHSRHKLWPNVPQL